MHPYMAGAQNICSSYHTKEREEQVSRRSHHLEWFWSLPGRRMSPQANSGRFFQIPRIPPTRPSLTLRRLRCHFFRWSRASWEAEGAWCLEMGTSESLASQIGLLKILKIGILKILKYVNREFRSWDKYCHLSTSSADLGLVYTGKYREGHRIPS